MNSPSSPSHSRSCGPEGAGEVEGRQLSLLLLLLVVQLLALLFIVVVLLPCELPASPSPDIEHRVWERACSSSVSTRAGFSMARPPFSGMSRSMPLLPRPSLGQHECLFKGGLPRPSSSTDMACCSSAGRVSFFALIEPTWRREPAPHPPP